MPLPSAMYGPQTTLQVEGDMASSYTSCCVIQGLPTVLQPLSYQEFHRASCVHR